jgi:hypothetical protein
MTSAPTLGAGSACKVDVVANSNGSRVAVLLLNGRGNAITDAQAGAAVTRLFCAAQR